ncbi:MAG TPA: hypothetical protein VK752_05370 [Bryobacteraceae bacterium]|jgi:hypothetical protein|nr:hypothetical protein [Bryobacteraceae bacterium]
MEDKLITELKAGDRVVLTCEKARNPGSRPAKFDGLIGELAFFLVQSHGPFEMHMVLKVQADGTLLDDESRTITLRRDEHREAHG